MSKITDRGVLLNIITILNERKISQAKLIESLNALLPIEDRIKARTTFSDWKHGKSKSYMKFLPQIAEVLNVPVSALYGEEKVKADMTASIRGAARIALKEPSESDVLRLYRKASPEARAFIHGYLVKSAEVETPVVAAVDKTALIGVEKNPVVGVMEPRRGVRGEMRNKAKGGVKVKVRSGGKK